MVQTSNLGYPRIGDHREWKKTLESFWANEINEVQFLKQMKDIRLQQLTKQKEKQVDVIPVGDFTFYDHVLDTAVMFGLVPERFQHPGNAVSLSTYFAIARGNQEAQASEMTKWFNTNYHYIVPEWSGQTPTLTENKPLKAYLEAKEEVGIEGKPVLLGPFTFLKCSKGYEQDQFENLLKALLSPYKQLLLELQEAGVKWVQIDEPSLVTSISDDEMKLVAHIYRELTQELPNLSIMLQTYFEAVTHYEAVIGLPVQGIGLDFVAGYEENMQNVEKFGFPKDKVLGVGIIDGRNIWKENLLSVQEKLEKLLAMVPSERQWLQPSCSLQHVPVSIKYEDSLHTLLKQALAFGDEKLEELQQIKQFMTASVSDKETMMQTNQAIFTQLAASKWRTPEDDKPEDVRVTRSLPFQKRRVVQEEKWQLPFLPTTTIGSFPQTTDLRRVRRNWRNGELEDTEYEQVIKQKIKEWIAIQEEIGLDVLVHGEFERTDMVEFFGEKLEGFAFTKNGWVQSYGSRCVKPPLIYGNVNFIQSMTVKETIYAQSLTKKPVKGMLTGPVTIVNWSFVRNDIPRHEVAYQIAKALIQEVQALEKAGIEMIQVDEPALREGLPLKVEKWQEYLTWAVRAFRLATSDVLDTTQIHTHMCYSEFGDIIDSIKALDADVISIETSRSHGDLIYDFEQNIYDKGIGLGVYDIHSPRVPSEEEMCKVIQRALSVLPNDLFWVNPDCGLKTRREEETILALKNMVQATKQVRKEQTVTN